VGTSLRRCRTEVMRSFGSGVRRLRHSMLDL
jgi:hypothetical protein